MLKNILLLIMFLSTGIAYSQWFQQVSGTTADLNSVFHLSTGHGFIVGNSGTFLKTTDGGMNWNLSTLTPAEDFNAVYFLIKTKELLLVTGV